MKRAFPILPKHYIKFTAVCPVSEPLFKDEIEELFYKKGEWKDDGKERFPWIRYKNPRTTDLPTTTLAISSRDFINLDEFFKRFYNDFVDIAYEYGYNVRLETYNE